MAMLSQALVTGGGSGFIREPVTGSCLDSGVEPVTGSKMADWCWVLARRRLLPDNVLFEEGDIHCRLSSKYVPLEDKAGMDSVQKRIEEFPCGVAKCSQTFQTLAKFETHYHSVHRNVCQTCRRVYPSAHLLDLHVQEAHDVMFALLADKQNMFQCLLEDCVERFSGCRQRRDHMIGVHKYPSNYRYDNHKAPRKPKKSTNKSTGTQHRKSASAANAGVTMETESEADEQASMTHAQADVDKSSENGVKVDTFVDMDSANGCEVETGMTCVNMDSANGEMQSDDMKPETRLSGRVFSYKVPDSLCFGQGVSRGFTRGRGRGRGKKRGKHWHNAQGRGGGDTGVNIESVDMMELSDALPT